MASITWYGSKPKCPLIGDCFVDPASGNTYVYQGTNWVIISGDLKPTPPFIPPTEEQLEKYPTLKKAWEEFLIIRKLVGV